MNIRLGAYTAQKVETWDESELDTLTETAERLRDQADLAVLQVQAIRQERAGEVATQLVLGES